MKIASNEKKLLNDIKKFAIKGEENRIIKHIFNVAAILNIPTPDIYVIPYILSFSRTLILTENISPLIQSDLIKTADIPLLLGTYFYESNTIALSAYSIFQKNKFSDALLLYTALQNLRMAWHLFNNPADVKLNHTSMNDITYEREIDTDAFARLYTDFVYIDKPDDYYLLSSITFATDNGQRNKRLEELKEEYGSMIEQLINL